MRLKVRKTEESVPKRKANPTLEGIRAGALSMMGLTLVSVVMYTIQVINKNPSGTHGLGTWGGVLFTASGLACGFSLYWVFYIGGRTNAKYILLSLLSAVLTSYIVFLVVRYLWDLAG